MRFREIVFAACAAMPASAWAQGVIPTNNAAIFSAQPVQTPSGTTTGTLATRWGNRLDLVADFGADPTGSVDATSALQSAVNNGKPFFVPPGTYKWTGALTNPNNSNVSMTCADPIATTFDLSGSLNFSVSGAMTYQTDVQNCGFAFSGAGFIAISATAYNNSQPNESAYFHNNFFNVPSTSTASTIITFNNVSSVQFLSNKAFLSGFSNTFLYLENASINDTFSNNQIWSTASSSTASIGLYMNSSANPGPQGVRVTNDNWSGFGTDVDVGSYAATVLVSNSVFDQAQSSSIMVNGTNTNDIIFVNNYFGLAAPTNSGKNNVTIQSSINVELINNMIYTYNGGNSAMYVSALSNEVFMLNNLYGNNITGIYNPNNVTFQPLVVPSSIQAISETDARLTTTNATVGATTLTAANLFGETLIRGGTQTAAFTDTTDTAANILAQFNNPPTGYRWRTRILNTTSYTETIAAGTGVTISGTATIAAGAWRDYDFAVTSSSAITMTNVGSGSQ